METKFLKVVDPPRRDVQLVSRSTARGLALFLGGFTLLNLSRDVFRSHFDANLFWIDLRILPWPAAHLLLLLCGLCLVGLGLRPPRLAWRRRLTKGCVAVAMAAALWNSAEFYALLARGRIHSPLPIPLSLLVFLSLLFIWRAVLRQAHRSRTVSSGGSEIQTFAWSATALFTCLIVFPVAQMLLFGKTDYRRPADAVVVLGARTYADGRPSDALADRVRTASQLYRDGLAGKVILSGGPGDGAIRETDAMRTMALGLGVKAEDILVDQGGLNTQATVKNTEVLFGKLNAHRILVVSHFYHLARVKLAYQRSGWEVYTVPAHESYFLRQMPMFMAREVPALWVYYFRPLVSGI